MGRTRKLSTAEIFFIEEKTKAGLTPTEIATALNMKLESVTPHVPVVVQKERVETHTSQSFARHPRGGIVVGTPTASQLGEGIKGNHAARTDCIAPTKK